jgi:hypothetical protein
MIRVAISASSVMLAPYPVPDESKRLGRLAVRVPYSLGRPVAVILEAESISDRFPATLPFIDTVSESGGRSWSRFIGVVVLPVAEMDNPGMDTFSFPTMYPSAEMDISISGSFKSPHLAPVVVEISKAGSFAERLISVGREAVADSDGVESRPVIIEPIMADNSMDGRIAPSESVDMTVPNAASIKRAGR